VLVLKERLSTFPDGLWPVMPKLTDNPWNCTDSGGMFLDRG